MTIIFSGDEFLDLCKKILRHEGYIHKISDEEFTLTEKGKIVVREIEHI